ncbi:MAG: DUF2851 family protein [Dehalococcoidales bacterium]
MNNVTPKLRENQVAEVWQRQLVKGMELLSEKGDALEIIYPGRLNDDRGADFRDAVISLNGRMLRGDVEIHVRSGSWIDHKHHRDPVYNRVILHVVMWHSGSTVTRLQNGGEIPVLALSRYLEIPLKPPVKTSSFDTFMSLPCLNATRRINANALAGLLDEAGDQRFYLKTARFQKEMERMSAGQSLYRGVMGALGYSRNKLPFLELADRLPLHILESPADGGLSDSASLTRNQALLLGTAGFLAGQYGEYLWRAGFDGTQISELDKVWASRRHSRAMTPDDWRFFKVRPNNSPLRRLAAMGLLLLRYRETGLLNGLLGLVTEMPEGQDHYGLERGLLISGNANRTGLSGPAGAGLPFLGRARAADIIINILLPFTSAWSRHVSRPEPGRKALDLYGCYQGAALNSIEKHMAGQLGLSRGMIQAARRRQGIIHIYASLCIRGRCLVCPLTQLEAGSDIQVEAGHPVGPETEIAAGGDHGGIVGA